MPLVLGVGASRMCRSARLRVAWRTRSCAGRHRWRAYGIAADDPSLGVRPSQRGWRSSGLRLLGTARRAGNDLLAHRHGERMRPALEPFAMAACRDRHVHRRHRRSCPKGVSGRRCESARHRRLSAHPVYEDVFADVDERASAATTKERRRRPPPSTIAGRSTHRVNVLGAVVTARSSVAAVRLTFFCN